jgi:ABC-2 type transport system permease protein
MRAAVRAEWLKMKRSPVGITTSLLLAIALPLMGFGMYYVAERGGAGPLADKARGFLVGEGWAGYVGLVEQIVAVALFLGVGVMTAWVFGREHSDRTFPGLFGLPVSRSTIARAKFLVMGWWTILMVVMLVAVTALLGIVAGIEPTTLGDAAAGLGRLSGIAILAALLAFPSGYVASVGRGYLPAVGAIVLIVAISQVVVLLGTGGWFPFAIPGLLAVGGSLTPTGIQVALVPTTGGLGMWMTVRWWRRAESNS